MAYVVQLLISNHTEQAMADSDVGGRSQNLCSQNFPYLK